MASRTLIFVRQLSRWRQLPCSSLLPSAVNVSLSTSACQRTNVPHRLEEQEEEEDETWFESFRDRYESQIRFGVGASVFIGGLLLSRYVYQSYRPTFDRYEMFAEMNVVDGYLHQLEYRAERQIHANQEDTSASQ